MNILVNPEAMASADLSDELLCSICLNTFTDPVTLRCGHNFCRVCIAQFLNTLDGSGVYSCPECREQSQERPTLIRNITLHNLAESFRSTQPHQEEITGIYCTFCVDSPVPAVRSCLMCEASLCDKHLKVHSKEPDDVLNDPRTSLENRRCPIHKELLKYYCTMYPICICVSCSLAAEHRRHRVKMLDEASEKKKKLRNVLQKLISKREKTEERVQSPLEHLKKALVTWLQTISSPKAMRPQPPRVRSQPSHKQASPVSGPQYGGDGVIVRTVGEGAAAGEGGVYGQGPADILLDVNTAANYMIISDDMKTATWTDIKQNRPETAERFWDNSLVMSSRRFSSGRHYWDVEIKRSAWQWMVGMCYPSIDRRGSQSFIGYNNKSWCLDGGWWRNNQCSVTHDSKGIQIPHQISIGRVRIYLDCKKIQLPHQISSDGIRICLDYEAGQLSFYELCDPIRHLHTFTTTFTEPLHAVFYIWNGSIKISGGGAAVRRHHRGNLPRDW